MNIAEILKECPKGTKLYSPIYGELELVEVKDEQNFSIYCITKKRELDAFTSEGRIYSDYPDAECMLFPSKDQRDWGKFVVPDQKPKYQFKPFDKVLVRDDNEADWKCDFFSNISNSGYYHCINAGWKQCIPYEGNEHLLGTTNKPE